jgi:hypothetical protein
VRKHLKFREERNLGYFFVDVFVVFFFFNFLVVISMVNEKSFYSLIYFSLQRGPWFVRFYSLCIFFGEKKKNYTISPPRVNKVWFQWYLIFKFFKSYNCSLYNIFFINVGVRVSLYASRLIPRALKLTTM